MICVIDEMKKTIMRIQTSSVFLKILTQHVWIKWCQRGEQIAL